MDIAAKQVVEREFWRTSEDESPESNSIHNLINKTTEAKVLLDCLRRYRLQLATQGRVLELGGGQGWASCIYKRLFPAAHITTSDISEHAIASVSKWERIFETKVDNAYACLSYEIREPSDSVNQIFCFAAAHHFLAHKRTLREIHRVLSCNGSAYYFYEPSTPRYLYRLAYWRVNKKRPQVPEDVLITAELQKRAAEVGLRLRVDYYPSTVHRGLFETFYYAVLSRIPVLQRILPCTANFIFTKPPVPSCSR
jgi:ubiquinone/menaquinone biosynthesis C-methylase UbiE